MGVICIADLTDIVAGGVTLSVVDLFVSMKFRICAESASISGLRTLLCIPEVLRYITNINITQVGVFPVM